MRKALGRLVALFPVLKRTQFGPSSVLLGFGGIGVFCSLEPKAEPIHLALVRDRVIPRLLQNVRPFREISHFYRLTAPRQPGIAISIRQLRFCRTQGRRFLYQAMRLFSLSENTWHRRPKPARKSHQDSSSFLNPRVEGSRLGPTSGWSFGECFSSFQGPDKS